MACIRVECTMPSITLSKLIEEIKRLLDVAMLNEGSHEIVVDDGVSCITVVGHLVEEVDDFLDAVSDNEALGEIVVGDVGGEKGSISRTW